MARKRRKPIDSSRGKSKVGISLTSKAFDLLNKIAEKAQLSKSELIERFVLGSMGIASNEAEKTVAIETDTEGTKESPTQVKIAIVTGTPEAEDKESKEKNDSTIEQIEAQRKRIAELENNLAEQTSLASLQAESSQSLQQQTQEQAELIDTLQQQLTAQQSLLEEKQRQTQEQAVVIDNLQQQLTTQQALLEEKIQNCESLQQQTQEQAELIDKLQKQLTAQQSLLEERTQNYSSLQRQIQEQAELIVDLQEELEGRERVATLVAYIDRLKPLADIGKMYLKKRDRTYF